MHIKQLSSNPTEAFEQVREELRSRLAEISKEFKSRKFTEEDSYGAGYEDRMAMEHNYLLRLVDKLTI